MKKPIQELSILRLRSGASIFTFDSTTSGEMTTFSPEQIALFRTLVAAKHGETFTTSRKVAELFGKRHDNVLRTIDKLECSSEFRLLNFKETVYYRKNPSGGEDIATPMWHMTKDGMVFLVMGFTGKQAAQFKELYIQAFNWLADQIRKSYELTEWLNDFTRREAASVTKGTVHGQGLVRRRIEKHALSQEQAAIHAKIQLCLDLIGEEAA